MLFEPRDMWIGMYWAPRSWGYDMYVCIIPCFPICFTIRRALRSKRDPMALTTVPFPKRQPKQ